MQLSAIFCVFCWFLPLTQSKIPQKLFSPPGRKHNCAACPPHPDVPKMQFSWGNIIAAIQATRCIKCSLVYVRIDHFWIYPSCGAGVHDGHFLTSITKYLRPRVPPGGAVFNSLKRFSFSICRCLCIPHGDMDRTILPL